VSNLAGGARLTLENHYQHIQEQGKTEETPEDFILSHLINLIQNKRERSRRRRRRSIIILMTSSFVCVNSSCH
jgi:hypothetical protein